MRKCNDEVYPLAKDQALDKKLKNKRFRPFCLFYSTCEMWLLIYCWYI